MSHLTNERIDQLWDEAEATDNLVVMELIEEIDRLKNTSGNLWRRFQINRQHHAHVEKRLTKKRFHQGQTYMRGKIADTLRSHGMTKAAEIASRVFVDYDIEPVGNWERSRGGVNPADTTQSDDHNRRK